MSFATGAHAHPHMTQNYFETLREANVARQVEWTGGSVAELTWSGSELAGEIGEAAELLMEDAAQTGPTREDWFAHLGEEIADGLICVDLTAINAGLDAIEPAKLAYTNSVHMSALLGVAVGRVCNTLKKLERERRGWPGSRSNVERLAAELATLSSLLGSVAAYFEIDPRAVVSRKFNKTSEKVGLKARLINH